MRPEITLYTGTPKFGFEPLRRLEAICSAINQGTASVDTVNAKLRAMAAAQGADAVIDVAYHGDASTAAGTYLRATGFAVRKLAKEISCPNCGELIERSVQRCRFCGHPVIEPGSQEAIRSREAIFTPTLRRMRRMPRIALPTARTGHRSRRAGRVRTPTIASAGVTLIAIAGFVLVVLKMMTP